MAKLLLDTPKKLALAIAQVIEDYPERWTKHTLAQTNFGYSCSAGHPQAFSFCTIGMVQRLILEGSANNEVADKFYYAFSAIGVNSVAAVNDRSTSRQMVRTLRRVAERCE